MSTIRASLEDGVLNLRFARPAKKNALTLECYDRLAQHIRDAGADDAVRCITLTGEGDAFTSGNDIANFRDRTGRESGGPAERLMVAIIESAKPLIAAVNGPAVGVGATMLPHFDLVFASERASFRFPFVQLGLCCEFASSLMLPAVMGLSRASELLLLGEDIDARKAFEFGLVNRVVPHELLQESAGAAARRIAGQPPESVQVTREFLRRGLREALIARLREERATITGLLERPHARQAMEAFFNRRA